ncbi:MAG TPA: hypothetical protein VF192_04715 [Longimicrobiales bacterium]
MHENLYVIAHPEYFESPTRYTITPHYADVLASILPEGWKTVRDGPWLGVSNGAAFPPQGFKIHVSSIPAQAQTLLRLVASECVDRGFTFKVAADPRMLHVLNSKGFNRGNSGKFITIYPPTEDAFRELIEALYVKTRDRDFVGPYILSDRRYKDSKVLFYRYGGFERRQRLNIDGTKTPLIQSPAGEWVPDVRTPFFQLPEWVRDPFPTPADEDGRSEPILRGRFRVESAIRFSNSGGIYAGTDLETGQEIVIKEARPYTAPWTVGGVFLHASRFLEREWAILQRLQRLGCVPKAIALFTEWEHTFLVEEFIRGTTYWNFWVDRENLLCPFIRRPGRIEAFLPKFRATAEALIKAVASVHAAGVVLGDLSPRNVFITRDPFEVRFIDFEGATVLGETNGDFAAFGRQWHTPGYMNPERSTRATADPSDDWYAVGMLLYCAVIPVQQFFALHPSARDLFLDECVRLGIPPEVRHIINALLHGRPDEASHRLAAAGW